MAELESPPGKPVSRAGALPLLLPSLSLPRAPLSSPQPALYFPSTPTLSPEPGFPLISSKMPAPSTLAAVDWPTLVRSMLMDSIVSLCLRQPYRPCLACPRFHSEHSCAARPLLCQIHCLPSQVNGSVQWPSERMERTFSFWGIMLGKV